MILIYIIIASLVVSAISFIGILLLLKNDLIERHLPLIISISAGALLAVTFWDLLPEALDSGANITTVLSVVLLSILAFFILEKYFHWHHCHCKSKEEDKKHLAYLNLIGDGLHNFLDGVLIASTFVISVPLGITTTLAIILHEIPQEITDFGVLLYSGLSKKRALAYNFLTALTALFGAIIAYYFINQVNFLAPYILALAAGNFIYLATADLIPELHHEKDSKKMIVQTIMLLAGVAIIWLIQNIVNI